MLKFIHKVQKIVGLIIKINAATGFIHRIMNYYKINGAVNSVTSSYKNRMLLFGLAKLNVFSNAISSVASKAIAFLFFLVFITIGSIALALLLGYLIGKMYIGFVIIAGMYFLLVLLSVLVLPRYLKNKFGVFLSNLLTAK